MSLEQKLDQVLTHYEEVREKLSGSMDEASEFARLSKEYSDLTPIAEKILERQLLVKEADTLNEFLADPSLDKELHDMAQEDLQRIHDRLPHLFHEIQVLLLPKDADDDRNAILEIRAGTGGEEAALFGATLLRMYQRYAELQGWRFELSGESAA